MARLSLLAPLLVLCAFPICTHAGIPKPGWPEQIRKDLIRLGQVEWQLRRSMVSLCPVRGKATGLVIDYIGAYTPPQRDFVRSNAGLGDLPQVLAVIDGSPAQGSGIRPGDEFVEIGGRRVSDMLASAKDPSLLADDIEDRLAAYPAGHTIALLIRRGAKELPIAITPEVVCEARLILKTDSRIAAYSDGVNIAVTTGLLQFAQNDDELALVAGHELAHVIEYRSESAGLFGSRRMEDRADLFGAKIAQCAGYDVRRSLAFWRRLATQAIPTQQASKSHRSIEARLALLNNAFKSSRCSSDLWMDDMAKNYPVQLDAQPPVP